MQTIRGSVRRRIVVIYSFLIVFSLPVWTWALVALHGRPRAPAVAQ